LTRYSFLFMANILLFRIYHRQKLLSILLPLESGKLRNQVMLPPVP